MIRRLIAAVLALSAALVLLAGCQQQASYPNRGIEFVVHSSAGGGQDIMARSIVDIFTKEKMVSQPVTVVNKTGGAGAVASAYIADKKGDAHTLYGVTAVQVLTPLTGASNVFLKDLTPVAGLATDSNVMTVRADSPFKTLKDLVDASKQKPLTHVGGSITSDENTSGFQIKKTLGGQWEFVSYASGGEAVTALLGGHGDFSMSQPMEVAEQIRAGKLRGLAVYSQERIKILPDVPTTKELGIPTLGGTFRGIYMPANVPADAVKYWEDIFGKLVKTDAWKKYLADSALRDTFTPAKDFQALTDSFAKENEALVNEMGLVKKK